MTQPTLAPIDQASWDFVINEIHDVIKQQELVVEHNLGRDDIVDKGWLAGLRFALKVAKTYDSDEWEKLKLNRYRSVLSRHSQARNDGLFLQVFLAMMGQLYFSTRELEIRQGKSEKFQLGIQLSMFRWINVMSESDLPTKRSE